MTYYLSTEIVAPDLYQRIGLIKIDMTIVRELIKCNDLVDIRAYDADDDGPAFTVIEL